VSSADKFNTQALLIQQPALRTTFLGFLALCLMFTNGPAAASEFMIPVKSIAQITTDDDNRALNYPVTVSFDPVEEEIYIINGGSNRVVVYGPDFFPRASIGAGRDIISPRGIRVMNNGEVYICQVRNAKNPSPRISILNGAFFIDREIFLDQIPEAPNFKPKALVLSRDNIIYLAGDNERGVLVLDNEGNFLRWLQPIEQITLRGEEAREHAEEEKKLAEQEQPFSVAAEGTVPEEFDYSKIPEEFRPKTEEELYREMNVEGPVKINHINIDSAGNLYLISAEVGKIYVYGPDESLLFSFGKKGGSPGQMSLPQSLAFDEEHELIYVTDYMRHTILAYDYTTGDYLFEFGGRGINPTWFNFPSSITVNNYGQLIIADLFNRRVQVLEIDFEAAAYYRGELPPESSQEESDAAGEQGQEELIALQPGDPGDEENIPEAPPEEFDDLTGQVEPEPLQEEDQISPAASGSQDQPAHAAAASEPQSPAAEAMAKLLEPDKAAVKTADFDAVEQFVASWAEAWQQKDIEAYLANYSRDFNTPGGITFAAWEIQRHQSLGRPKFISIEIRDMQIEKVNDSRARVTFIQKYSSDTYSDEVVKTLDLIWENWSWKILQEASKGLAESSESEDSMPHTPTPPPVEPAPAAEAKVPETAAAEDREIVEKTAITAADPSDFADVETFVESWVTAWKQQDAITYLSYYSSNFIAPGGKSVVAWGKERYESFDRQKFINIEIQDLQVKKVNDSRMQVTFIQKYQSDTYSDKVLKTLDLVLENGDWMILQETSKAL